MRSIAGPSGRGLSIAIAGAGLLLAVACQGSVTTPSPSATTATPTAEATSPAPPSATLAPTPTAGPLLPGRLLFSRFNEANHSNQGSFISLPNGTEEVQVPLPWTEGLARWSTSGTEITVATQHADGRVGTAVVSPDGTVLRVLDIPDATLNLPCVAWSADDTRLACEGWDDADPSRSGIYSVRASDGGDLRRMSSSPVGAFDLPGGFSSSGRFVFLRGSENEGGGPLMLLDPAGGEPQQLGTETYEDAGRFSPDGLLVLTAGRGLIAILDLKGEVVNRIVDDDGFLFGPVWSPDGTHIAFSRATRAFIADIWTSLPDGSDRQQVTRTPANEINVDWGVGG